MSTRQKLGLLLIAVALFSVFRQGCDLPVVGPVAPFKTDKLAVLVVEETAQRNSYTADQRAAILSTAPGSLIATVKARGGDIRIVDKDQSDFSKDAPWVASAFAVPHSPPPWIVAAGPKSGVSKSLPATTAEILKAVEAAK